MKRKDKSIEPKEIAAAMRIPRPQEELETETTMESAAVPAAIESDVDEGCLLMIEMQGRLMDGCCCWMIWFAEECYERC
jgi:hypothetical protein